MRVVYQYHHVSCWYVADLSVIVLRQPPVFIVCVYLQVHQLLSLLQVQLRPERTPWVLFVVELGKDWSPRLGWCRACGHRGQHWVMRIV